MKIKLLKKSATIQLESKDEVQAMAKAIEYYMTMVFQPASRSEKSEDSHHDCDDIMNQLDKKFNKE